MGDALNDFKKWLAEKTFGPTPEGCCVKCKEAFSDKNVFTHLGWKETRISHMCEKCWDDMFKGK